MKGSRTEGLKLGSRKLPIINLACPPHYVKAQSCHLGHIQAQLELWQRDDTHPEHADGARIDIVLAYEVKFSVFPNAK